MGARNLLFRRTGPLSAIRRNQFRASKNSEMRFRNRSEAGRFLVEKLRCYAGRADVLVLALPRGGVPVGFEIAMALRVPLDVFLVRKLGLPGHEELAMGAIAMGGIRVLNQEVMEEFQISAELIETVAAEEQIELQRREHAYRGDRPSPVIKGRAIILVDDGIATGSTMHVAVAALRKQDPSAIVVAVPTAAPSARDEFRNEVEEFIVVETPEKFVAVGQWYEDFSQTTDAEVSALLQRMADTKWPDV
jgi:putative phosphoribosyl transferase